MAILNLAKMVLRSMVNKPATLMYPVVQREYTENTRGHIDIDVENCVFCGICNKKCPTNAIEVNRNDKKWAIERLQCIQCNCCVEVCPKKCLKMENTYTTPSTGKVRDEFQDARVPDNTTDN